MNTNTTAAALSVSMEWFLDAGIAWFICFLSQTDGFKAAPIRAP